MDGPRRDSRGQSEGFVGGYHSPDRRLALHSGVFSLVGTLVGGGTLSVPWAVTQSGIALGLVLLLAFGMASALSVQFLLSAARRCGGLRTYDEVLERACGRWGRLATMAAVLLTCFFTLVANQILLRQLAWGIGGPKPHAPSTTGVQLIDRKKLTHRIPHVTERRSRPALPSVGRLTSVRLCSSAAA
jgi:hypothetical protein